MRADPQAVPDVPRERPGWFRWRRPGSRWDVLCTHAPGLLIGGTLTAASVFLRPEWLPSPLCGFLRLTGYPCPFCGSTRTFIAMGHGQFQEAFAMSPMAAVLFLGCVGLFLWSAIAVLVGRIVLPGTRLLPGRRGRVVGAVGLALLVLANWAYRIAAGLR